MTGAYVAGISLDFTFFAPGLKLFSFVLVCSSNWRESVTGMSLVTAVLKSRKDNAVACR